MTMLPFEADKIGFIFEPGHIDFQDRANKALTWRPDCRVKRELSLGR
jgi:hypothetical protein